jgi:hypothetical protein
LVLKKNFQRDFFSPKEISTRFFFFKKNSNEIFFSPKEFSKRFPKNTNLAMPMAFKA